MFREYVIGDFKMVKVQTEQKVEAPTDDELWDSPDTFVYERNQKVYMIVRPFYEGGRVYLSALISADCGEVGVFLFRKMSRIIQDWLDSPDTNRVEFITQSNFKQANRLARMLGFTCEGTMRKYYNGIDFNIWGKIK